MIVMRVLFAAILVLALMSGARAQTVALVDTGRGDVLNTKSRISFHDFLREIRKEQEREANIEREMKDFETFVEKQQPYRRKPIGNCLRNQARLRSIIADAKSGDLEQRSELAIEGLPDAQQNEFRYCLRSVYALQYSGSLNETIIGIFQALNRRDELQGMQEERRRMEQTAAGINALPRESMFDEFARGMSLDRTGFP